MSEAGNALLGIGMGTGESRALEAAEHAVESPLLETSVEGAQSILLSITGGRDLSLWEVNEAAKAVAEAAHPDANIIFGAMVDEKLADEVWITVVATGYGDRPAPRRARAPRAEPSAIAADPEPRVTAAPARAATPSGAAATSTCPSSCRGASREPVARGRARAGNARGCDAMRGRRRSRSSADRRGRAPRCCARAATRWMPPWRRC